MKNNLVKTLVVGVLLVYTFSLVSAVNIGVSPATIKFDNVLRQGYAEDYIAVSVDSENEIGISLTANGEIADWLTFPEEEFYVSKENVKYVKISVSPPNDIPNGNYTGFLKVQSTSFGENIEDHAVGKILSTLDLSITVSVTDVEYNNCVVKNVEISSAEKGDDVLISMDVLNLGNVRLSPKVLFDIWDLDQIEILKQESFIGKGILPTIEESLEFRVNSKDLDLGQYWGDLSIVDCLYQNLFTFDILEEGALKSEGVLLNILSKKEAKVKETIPFEASFKNTGEKDLKATFKGRATYAGKIVQVFESEELIVKEGSVEKFLLYFTPQKEGKYVITGRVYYDSKKTFESSQSIEVSGSSFSFVTILYVLLFIVILGLIVKIKKEKKIYREKLRRLK